MALASEENRMNQEWTAVRCPDGKIDGLRQDMLRDAERLVSAVGDGKHGELVRLAQRLLATAREQFEAEERRLREQKSPSLVRHAREHDRFLADLGAMVAIASRGDTRGLGELKPERWIPEWLSAHARTDRDLMS
jgi:hemerythrin